MKRVVSGIVAVLVVAGAHGWADSDPWTALRAFEGKWEGPTSGKPGKGSTKREYRFVLGGRFLYQHDDSVYKGGGSDVVHEDLGYLDFDKDAKAVVWRQFHSEGFVNEYTLESVSADGRRLEFVTTRIENLGPGWRAKKVYQFQTHDQLDESFWLAAPNGDFSLYTDAHLRRVK